MPTQLWIARVVVLLLGAGFAHMLGRSLARRGSPKRSGTGPLSWTVRTVLAIAALTWRGGFDLLAIVGIAVSVLACAGGYFMGLRPKPDENLTRQMFPDD